MTLQSRLQDLTILLADIDLDTNPFEPSEQDILDRPEPRDFLDDEGDDSWDEK